MACRGGWLLLFLAIATFPAALHAQQDSASTRPEQVDTVPATDHPAGDDLHTNSSVSFTNTSLYSSLSASYASSDNWNGQDLRNFSLQGNLLYTHDLFAEGSGHSHQVMADLGYLKFVDSTWEKSIDMLQVNLLWNSTGRKFNSSYTVAFGTQFLPTSFPDYDFEQDKLVDRSIGGFLNPFNLQLGYGGVYTFWGRSNINFAFATIQFSSSPKEFTAPASVKANVIEGKKAYYFLNYGFSFSTAIKKGIRQACGVGKQLTLLRQWP